jgi:hypothetical protein
MPALSVCGQRTCLAGDELFIPSLLFIGVRLLQLAVLIPLTIVLERDSITDVVGCPEARPLIEKGHKLAVSYVVVSYILVVVGLVLEVGIVSSTRRGTPTTGKAATGAAIVSLETGSSLFASYSSHNAGHHCHFHCSRLL